MCERASARRESEGEGRDTGKEKVRKKRGAVRDR